MMPVLAAAFSLLHFENKGQEAIGLCRWMTDEYPNYPEAWEALCEAYWEQSKKSCESATQKARENYDRRLPVFLEEL